MSTTEKLPQDVVDFIYKVHQAYDKGGSIAGIGENMFYLRNDITAIAQKYNIKNIATPRLEMPMGEGHVTVWDHNGEVISKRSYADTTAMTFYIDENGSISELMDDILKNCHNRTTLEEIKILRGVLTEVRNELINNGGDQGTPPVSTMPSNEPKDPECTAVINIDPEVEDKPRRLVLFYDNNSIVISNPPSTPVAVSLDIPGVNREFILRLLDIPENQSTWDRETATRVHALFSKMDEVYPGWGNRSDNTGTTTKQEAPTDRQPLPSNEIGDVINHVWFFEGASVAVTPELICTIEAKNTSPTNYSILGELSEFVIKKAKQRHDISTVDRDRILQAIAMLKHQLAVFYNIIKFPNPGTSEEETHNH